MLFERLMKENEKDLMFCPLDTPCGPKIADIGKHYLFTGIPQPKYDKIFPDRWLMHESMYV